MQKFHENSENFADFRKKSDFSNIFENPENFEDFLPENAGGWAKIAKTRPGPFSLTRTSWELRMVANDATFQSRQMKNFIKIPTIFRNFRKF